MPEFKNESLLNNENATVYIYRSWRFFNGGGWPNIFLENQKMFALKNAGYGILNLKPGKYEIKAQDSFLFTSWYPNAVSINLNIEANKEYFIRLTPERDQTILMGDTVIMTGTAQMVIVSKEDAMKEIVVTKKVNEQK